MFSLMATFADIFRFGAVFGKLRNLRGIPAALWAVDRHRVIGFPLPLLGVLSPEAVQDVEYLAPLLKGFDDIILILAAFVHLRLVSVVHLDAELFDGSLEFLLEIFRVGLLLCAKRVGHIRIGCSDIFLHIISYLGYIDGNLPDPVILVPGEEKLRFLSLALQGFHHEQAGGDVPEIADVDGAGGTDAGSAYIFFLVRVSVYDFFRNLI